MKTYRLHAQTRYIPQTLPTSNPKLLGIVLVDINDHPSLAKRPPFYILA